MFFDRRRGLTRRRQSLVAIAVAFAGFVVVIGIVGSLTTPDPIVSTTSLNQPIGLNALAVDGTTGRVFIATAGMYVTPPGVPRSHIDVFDSHSGSLQQVKELGTGLALLTLDQRDGRVFVADGSLAHPDKGEVYAFDAATGAVLRSVSISAIPSAIAADTRRGRIFVASMGMRSCGQGGCVSEPAVVDVLDARTLHILRTTRVGPAPRTVVVDERSGRVFVNGSQGLDILDASTGGVIRSMTGIARVLAVDQRTHRVFVMNYSGRVSMLDDVDGHSLGGVPFRGMPLFGEGSRAAADDLTGNVYILDSGRRTLSGPLVRPGGVAVVDGADGHIIRTISIGRLGTSPSAIVIDPESHRAFIADIFANTVSVLDTQSGRVRSVIPVGLAHFAPQYIALDERTRHVIVESIETPGAGPPDAWAWIPSRIRAWLPFVPRRPPPPGSALPSTSVTVLDVARR